MASLGFSQRAGITSSKPKKLPYIKPKKVEKIPALPDNRRQIHALLLIEEEAAQQQYQALSHITEHGAEDKGIGDGHKHGRVQLIVGRKAIHLYIHLKGTENLVVMKFRGRVLKMLSWSSSTTTKVCSSSSISFWKASA